MPTPDLLLLAERQHGLLTRRSLRAHGLSARAVERRVRDGVLVPVTAEVLRLAGAPRTDRQRLLAAVLDRAGTAAASHESAAALWEVPGFALWPGHVLHARDGRFRPARLGTVHTTTLLTTDDLTVVAGIPVTRPERTVVDLAAAPGSHRQAIGALLDQVTAAGLASVDSVAGALDRHARRGRPGVALLRALLDERRGERGGEQAASAAGTPPPPPAR